MFKTQAVGRPLGAAILFQSREIADAQLAPGRVEGHTE